MTEAYSLFGLDVASELPLPGMPAGGVGGERVEVRFGPVAAPTVGWAEAQGEDLLIDVVKVGRFKVTRGREIVIDPAPGASERNLRVFLLGSAMGALLHQRGILPLHANAIEIAGRAVAFSGRSGAGKSTLAAWFADRGRPILCDDVCAIGFDGDGRPIVHPGVPRLRLWQDALDRSGRSTNDFERSFDGQDKYDVPAGAAAARAPLQLGACYMLAEAGEGEEPGIARLAGLAAIEALSANTYRGRFLRLMGAAERHMRQCLAIAAAVPVHRARRRWGSERFDEEAKKLAVHAEGLMQ